MLAQTGTESVAEEVVTAPLASWFSRAGAFGIDVLFGLGVIVTMALAALTTAHSSWLWWLSVVVGGLVILLIAVNRLMLPAITGWSLGRAVFGIAVVRRDGAGVGPWQLLLRDLAHLLDTAALFVGWLWPLWDSRKRTFADLLLRTEVRSVERTTRNVRRILALSLIAALLLSAAASGLSYLTVYRHDEAVDHARAEVQDQGPKIVEEMLTYSAQSMQKDFAHAQTLVTDNYRKQLIQQQQSVQKGPPTNNEYWAVTSSVLSAATHKATMLMFLQGQRGVSQQHVRFITATARVDFEKSSEGKWLVSNLSVLTKPALTGNGK